jgi:hypothetical protein
VDRIREDRQHRAAVNCFKTGERSLVPILDFAFRESRRKEGIVRLD